MYRRIIQLIAESKLHVITVEPQQLPVTNGILLNVTAE